jgi:hypothetical protein
MISEDLMVEPEDIVRAFDRSIGYFLSTERTAPTLEIEDARSMHTIAQRFLEAVLWASDSKDKPADTFFRGAFRVFLDQLVRPRERAEAEIEQELRIRQHVEGQLIAELASVRKSLQEAITSALELKKELDEIKRNAPKLNESKILEMPELKLSASRSTGKPN